VTSHVAYQAVKIEQPTTIHDALNGDHSHKCKAAANQEYSSLIENDTWQLVKLPQGYNAIRCKWYFE